MGISGLKRVVAVAANSFRESVRARVLYNLLFFAVLMTLSGLLMGQLSMRQDEKILKDLGLAAMDIFGKAIAVFIGIGLISMEIERRSLYPLLASPLRRSEFLLGRFAGLSFTLLVNVAVMTVGLYLALLATGRRADPSLLKAVYAIYLGLLLTVAIALLFSTLTSVVPAAMCTIGLITAGHFADVIRDMQTIIPGAPSWLARVLYYAVPNFLNFDLKRRVVYGDPVTLDQLLAMTLYAAVYTSLMLAIAVVVFRRKDLK